MSEPKIEVKVDTDSISYSILFGALIIGLLAGPSRACNSRQEFTDALTQCEHLCSISNHPKECLFACLMEYRLD